MISNNALSCFILNYFNNTAVFPVMQSALLLVPPSPSHELLCMSLTVQIYICLRASVKILNQLALSNILHVQP